MRQIVRGRLLTLKGDEGGLCAVGWVIYKGDGTDKQKRGQGKAQEMALVRGIGEMGRFKEEGGTIKEIELPSEGQRLISPRGLISLLGIEIVLP